MNKTDRLMIIFSAGVLLISIVYTMAVVREQNIEKTNKKIMRRKQEVEQTFDVRMHRQYHDEIKGMLTDIRGILETNCK